MLVRRLLPLSLLLTALVAEAAPAHAGIVNMQSLLAKEADKGFTGAVSGSADWRTGNVDLLLLSASPIARYRTGKHLVLGVVRGAFGRSGDNRIIARTFEHLRYRNRVHKRFLLEAFAQHTYDEFKRLQLRALVGVGPKFDLAKGKRYHLSLGVAYMLEHERLNKDELPDAGDKDTAHRVSSYLTTDYQVDDRVQFIETFYFQPRVTDLDDTRLLSDTQLVMKLTKKISFTTTFSLAWDNRTPDGVADLDTALKSSVTVAF